MLKRHAFIPPVSIPSISTCPSRNADRIGINLPIRNTISKG